jgi:hypothetical protein
MRPRVKNSAILLLLISVFYAISVAAQLPASITGKVLDEQNQPVPFASVRLMANNSGVITNADGGFQIPARESFLRDTLVISCIGFKTRIVSMASLDLTKQNIIRLQSAAVQLSAVEIRASQTRRLPAWRLVQRAISRITYNYPNNPFGYIAYYRDYQIKDNQYFNVNEALVQVKDEGFYSNDQINTKIQLIEYKLNNTFPIDTLARTPYDNRERKFIPQASLKNFSGNELATLMVHDPIRNHEVFSFSFVNRLDKDFLKNHRFSFSGFITEGDKQLYIVTFNTYDHVSGFEHQGVGKLYIEKGNYRIHKLQYSTNEWQSHKPVPLYNVNVEYTHYDKLMYLSYISFNNEFKMRNPDDFKVKEVRQSRDSAGFVVHFSHQPTPITALAIVNYDFRIDGKPIKLKEAIFTQDTPGWPDYHMTVLVKVSNTTLFNEYLHDSNNKMMTFDVTGIRDFRDRLINVKTYLDATQYREIFVQQLATDPLRSTNYPAIDKFTPLHKIPTTNVSTHSNYWMNTPLKKEMKSAEEISN